MNYENPIIPGFFPDPSVVRVGEDYYLVNSTFAYFPGIPVFHSRDLAHWEQVGNVLTRKSQLPLEGCGHSEGIFAPTIRYHEGVFYVVCTNVSGGGNFIVTAGRPEGPWSEVHKVDGPGIDPSLFFDDDGSCWFIGQREKQDARYYGDCEVWMRRLDLESFTLEGETFVLGSGYSKNAYWTEGPHLYKRNGWYYLMHAEGGTADNHSVMIARSREITGPYEYFINNPLFTHRHLGKHFPVTCTGHADLTDDPEGNWYMVMLGCRPDSGYTLKGRETFLAEVVWEEDWPVVNPGAGMLKNMKTDTASDVEVSYTFTDKKLPPEFVMLRNPEEGLITFTEKGDLRLSIKHVPVSGRTGPAFAGVRQQYDHFAAEASVSVHAVSEGDAAGLVFLQDNKNYILSALVKEEDGMSVRLSCRYQDFEMVVAEELPDLKEDAEGNIKLQFRFAADNLTASAAWREWREDNGEDDGWNILSEEIDLRPLSTERAGGFTGCVIGMYSAGEENAAGGYADFHEFAMK